MTSTILTTTPQLVGGLGGMELLIVLAVLVLLFGASKLPELARGSGQALRIFKAETKGLTDADAHQADEHQADGATPAVADASPEPAPVIVETPRGHDAPRG